MPSFAVALLHVQDADLIIVPAPPSLQEMSPDERGIIRSGLQREALATELTGTVIMVWPAADGQIAFTGPDWCEPMLKTMTMAKIEAILNNELSW